VRGRTKRTYSVGRSDLGKRVSCSAVAKNGTLSTSVSQRVTVPRQCKVPNVRGLTPADAKTKLGNAGCRSTTKRIGGSGVPVGRVLGTSPGKGKKRPNGARITINVRK
jgi:beta-lactam-binding protein with PASTA domain